MSEIHYSHFDSAGQAVGSRASGESSEGPQPQRGHGISPDASPLSSYGHICTHEVSAKVEFWIGGSLMKVTKSKHTVTAKRSGGKRSIVTDFSRKSQARLLTQLNQVKKTCIPVFVTLTHPDDFPDVEQSKKNFRAMAMRMKRKWGNVVIEWKLEPQKRGAPHYHCFVWNVPFTELMAFVPVNWYAIAGQGDINHLLFHLGQLKKSEHCVQKIKSWNGVMWYAAKYFSKPTDSDWNHPGRFWGIIGREFMPWAELITAAITDKQAAQLFRLMRRKIGRKAFQCQSMKLFCDSEFWFDRLDRLIT